MLCILLRRYDHYVLLLDFNSLYPSIVQEYNLCFTTVERPAPLPDGTLPPPQLPEQGSEVQGVLPRLIKSIVERRRDVKRLLAKESDPAKRAQHDTRQKALKIMANSMYGCLGFAGSRFYARPIAELICTTGRATLQRTVDVAEANGLEVRRFFCLCSGRPAASAQRAGGHTRNPSPNPNPTPNPLLKTRPQVIYGDTDSIMIHSRSKSLPEARGMAATLKKEVNRLYKCLEIEVDGVFEMMLLLKKKKCAARCPLPCAARRHAALLRATAALQVIPPAAAAASASRTLRAPTSVPSRPPILPPTGFPSFPGTRRSSSTPRTAPAARRAGRARPRASTSCGATGARSRARWAPRCSTCSSPRARATRSSRRCTSTSARSRRTCAPTSYPSSRCAARSALL